jgi:hypothetical protein
VAKARWADELLPQLKRRIGDEAYAWLETHDKMLEDLAASYHRPVRRESRRGLGRARAPR